MSQKNDIKAMAASTPCMDKDNNNKKLAKYIEDSGINPSDNCLTVVLKNASTNLNDFIRKVGDYNYKGSFNPNWTPPRQETYTDYNMTCPEGMTSPDNKTCVSPTNKGGPDECNPGQNICKQVTKQRTESRYGQTGNRPPSNFSSYGGRDRLNWGSSCGASWTMTPCPDGWWGDGNTCWAPWWYWGPCSNPSGFSNYGSWDKINWAWWCNRDAWQTANQCPDGWTPRSDGGCCAPSSYNGPCNGCQPIYGWTNTTVNYQDTECNVQPNASFGSEQDKKNYEQKCNVRWPQKQRTIPGFWSCNYGSNIGDDIASSTIINLGTVSGDNMLYNAALKAINSGYLRVGTSTFFAIYNGAILVARDGTNSPFVAKGTYQENCSSNMGKVELYEITVDFVDKLKKCADTNALMCFNNENTRNAGLESFSNIGRKVRDRRYLYILFLVVIFFVIIFVLRMSK